MRLFSTIVPGRKTFNKRQKVLHIKNEDYGTTASSPLQKSILCPVTNASNKVSCVIDQTSGVILIFTTVSQIGRGRRRTKRKRKLIWKRPIRFSLAVSAKRQDRIFRIGCRKKKQLIRLQTLCTSSIEFIESHLGSEYVKF